MSVSVLHHQEWELLGPGAPASERPNAVAERQRAAAAAPPRVPVSEPLEAVPWCAEAARHPTAPLATDERWQHIHTPTLKWDDHGAQTAAKVAARAAAAQAAERQARADQQLEAAESRAREEQQAALRAEAEALALRQSEEAAARQSEDAATVAAEAALLSARRRRELESARSAVVEAEAVQERSARSAEQAERSHSQAADEAESAEQAAGRAKRQLGGKAPRRSRRVAGGGALSSRLSPRELSDPDVVCSILPTSRGYARRRPISSSAHQLVRLQVTPHVEAHRDKIIQIVSQHPLPQPPSFDPAESSEVRHNPPSRVPPQTLGGLWPLACVSLTLSGCGVVWCGVVWCQVARKVAVRLEQPFREHSRQPSPIPRQTSDDASGSQTSAHHAPSTIRAVPAVLMVVRLGQRRLAAVRRDGGNA